jgi:hypothetical protein
MKPIELRINKCPGFYTVDKVWPGINCEDEMTQAVANKVFFTQVDAEIEAIHSGVEVWDWETKTLMCLID